MFLRPTLPQRRDVSTSRWAVAGSRSRASSERAGALLGTSGSINHWRVPLALSLWRFRQVLVWQ
jgi:hypothetical protein